MKRKLNFYVLLIAAALVLMNCGSQPFSGSGGTSSNQQTTAANRASRSAGPFYTGDGGKGMSLAVLEPAGKGVSAEDQWMLSLVQGSITGDFNRYSAITVVDRQNLDTVLAEQEQSLSGDYSDDDYVKLGKLTNARFILSGTITRTANAFMMELSVTDLEKGERIASHGPASITHENIENLSAPKAAALELLENLGITLTDSGRQELTSPVAVTQVQSQTALAKGVTAQRNGSTVAALNYLAEAAAFDADLPEADQRLAALSVRIESGNIGDNIRNEIQQRNAWVKLMEEAVAFYNDHPIVDLVIKTKMEAGGINFSRGSATITFDVWMEPNARMNSLYKLLRAVEATGSADQWGLGSLISELFKIRGHNEIYPGYFKFELSSDGVYLADNTVGYLFYERPGQGSGVKEGNNYDFIKLRSHTLEFKGVSADDINDNLEVKVIQAIRNTTRTADYVSSPYNWRDNNPTYLNNLRVTYTDKSFAEYFARRPNYRTQNGELRYTPPAK